MTEHVSAHAAYFAFWSVVLVLGLGGIGAVVLLLLDIRDVLMDIAALGRRG